MNKVFLVGRLVANPTTFANTSNTINSRFDLAVSDARIQAETYFIPCVCFGSTATFANNYLRKGTMIVLEGRLTRRKYQTKDGNTAYSMNVISDSIKIISTPSSSFNQNYSNDFYNNNYNVQTPNMVKDNNVEMVEQELNTSNYVTPNQKVSIDDAFANNDLVNQDQNVVAKNAEQKVNKEESKEEDDKYPEWMNFIHADEDNE